MLGFLVPLEFFAYKGSHIITWNIRVIDTDGYLMNGGIEFGKVLEGRARANSPSRPKNAASDSIRLRTMMAMNGARVDLESSLLSTSSRFHSFIYSFIASKSRFRRGQKR